MTARTLVAGVRDNIMREGWRRGGASVFRSGRSTSLSTSSTFPRPVVSTQADYSTASIEEAKNELMQLTNCFFLTCLPPVGRNWKSCPAKEEECNLDYADWSTQTHKRPVLLLLIPLFFFPSPFLAIIPTPSPLSLGKRAGVHKADGAKCVQREKKATYTTNK